MQVSDRFHLWQGLSRRVQDIASAPPRLPTRSTTPGQRKRSRTGRGDRRQQHGGQSGRTARPPAFRAVQALTRTGRSHSSVARELGLDCRRVGKYARARTWQEVMRRPPRKPSALDPYLDYLQQRWDEGQHSAEVLHEELQAKGYLGHYQRVKMAVAPLRAGPAPGRATRATTLPA